MSLYLETECEHGWIATHILTECLNSTLPNAEPHDHDGPCECPGGSRTKVEINYEAGAHAVNGYFDLVTSGRFRVNPDMAKVIIDAALGLGGEDT